MSQLTYGKLMLIYSSFCARCSMTISGKFEKCLCESESDHCYLEEVGEKKVNELLDEHSIVEVKHE